MSSSRCESVFFKQPRPSDRREASLLKTFCSPVVRVLHCMSNQLRLLGARPSSVVCTVQRNRAPFTSESFKPLVNNAVQVTDLLDDFCVLTVQTGFSFSLFRNAAAATPATHNLLCPSGVIQNHLDFYYVYFKHRIDLNMQ